MTRTTNKTRFNLSTIMRRAHSMFKNRYVMTETFGDCLRNAWAMAKAYARNGKASYTHGVEFVPVAATATTMGDAIAKWYATAPRGTYFGD